VIPEDIPSTQPIFAAIVNFFTEDNWHYAQLEEQSATLNICIYQVIWKI
jgi:hypothetical protein